MNKFIKGKEFIPGHAYRKPGPRAQKHVLVAGGAGFLGSHLCQRLLQDGWQVSALDNFSTGRERNIRRFREHSSFNVLSQCVTEPIDNIDVDEIFNLASPAAPPDYQADPIGTVLTNVLGARNMLDLAKRHNAKIFQASTSEVYGDPLVHPQPEDYWGNVNPTGPRACYDEGKRCAESLFFDHARLYGLEIKVGRIFNTYGPRMRPEDGRVVSNFIVQTLKGKPITVYGDGSQTRSFCYVDDLIDAFVHFIATDRDVQGPLNLGNPIELSVREVADIVIELVGSRTKIVHRPLPENDPRQRRPDITQAVSQLNWSPTVSFRKGLERTIEYFDKELAGGHLEKEEAIA